MTRKKTYFAILLAAMSIILVVMLMRIKPYDGYIVSIKDMLLDCKVFISALVLAFAFSKQKYYWLIMLACAFIVAFGIQFLFLKAKFALLSIVLRAVAFLIIVYAVDYIRLVGKRK